MSNRYFTCHTEKSPITYRAGEDIAFRISFREEGKIVPAPRFAWHIEGDFGLHKEGVESGETGELTLHASLPKAGFLYVFVTATEENGEPLAEADTFFGGAGVDISEIHSVTEKPKDYDAFWEACKKELYAVAPEIIEKVPLPADPAFPNHAVYDIKVACAGGIPVSGILTIPQDGKKHPCRVIYQGYGVKSAWFDFDEEENILCINAHGIHNREEEAYYTELFSGRLRNYGFSEEQNKNPHTCYFKYMMIRAAQAQRFMMTLPEWDGKNLTARGGSQGAVQSMHAAYLVPEVSFLDIFVPWLCDIEAGKAGRYCHWERFGTPAFPYFDLTLRACDIQTRTAMMAGLGDLTSPPSGAVAIYHNLKGKKFLALVQSREHIYVSPETEEFLV